MTTDPQTARYRHRTTEVEAVQWTGSNADQLRAFCGRDFDGMDPMEPGDWVVKADEDFLVFSPVDFATYYEPATAVAAPAETALRDRIAALFRHPPGVERLGDATPGEIADAVMAEFPDTARLHDQLLTQQAELAHLRGLLRTENGRANSAIDRETTTEEAEEAYRLAVSAALRLGTGANWEAIHDRAEDLTAEVAELTEARATNRRLNLRAQGLESELAAYRRAVGQWEVGERGTYISHASLRTIGLACGKDILGSVRHLKHFERVEQAEAAIERVRNYLASQVDAFPSNYPVAVPVADVLAALNLPAVVPAGAGEEPADETHSCANCDGIDPDTCLMNPNRPPEQCPAAEFEDYGEQCQKPAGHNLCSFEEQHPDGTPPAVGAQQPKEAAPAVPQCDGCGHLVHRARKCPAVRYGERCECDEPLATDKEPQP
jgi:hypothetical protein